VIYNIAILIPVFNRKEITLNCIRSLKLLDFCQQKVDIIIIDDGSTDGTSDAIANEFNDVILLKGNGDLWWTGAMNKGIEFVLANDYDYVFFLNDDLEFNSDFFIHLYNGIKKFPDAVISSIKLAIHKDKQEILVAGFKVEGFFHELNNFMAGDLYQPEALPEFIECDVLTGASLLMPVSIIRNIGMMDERHFPHNWGDLEYTRRASLKGFRCLVSSKSVVKTEFNTNTNYHLKYITTSSRLEYLRNLFDTHKYGYGFKVMWRMSLMHKPLHVGLMLYIRRMLGSTKWIVLKIILPKPLICRMINKNTQLINKGKGKLVTK